MVKIRLKRVGAKKKPFYRIVVADSRSPRDGRFIQEIGYYDPLKNPVVISVDKEKALDWLKKGVQLSETAKALFKKAGVMDAPVEVVPVVEESQDAESSAVVEDQ